MISTVDQIAADTGAKSLTGVLMSQDHKRESFGVAAVLYRIRRM